jgi:hypothetical protein
MERRRFVAAVGAAGAVTLAGCSNVRPSPEVVESNARSQLLGPTTIDVTIRNAGTSGDVKTVVKIYGKGDTVQSRHEKTVSIDSGSEREVTFEIELESEAEKYTAEASPAGLI